MNDTQPNYTPEVLLLAHIFGDFILQEYREPQPDNTCKIEFVTLDRTLSRDGYDTATPVVTMGRYTPTNKFLADVADTLAADMIDYVKSGGSAEKITANLVYGDLFSESDTESARIFLSNHVIIKAKN